jgi:hypothetical protein
MQIKKWLEVSATSSRALNNPHFPETSLYEVLMNILMFSRWKICPKRRIGFDIGGDGKSILQERNAETIKKRIGKYKFRGCTVLDGGRMRKTIL